MTQSSAVNFGTCWGTPQGQDLSMPSYMASGNQVVAEAVLRRWTTTTGQLIDDADYGYNLTELISSDLSPTDVSYAQVQAGAQAEQDERVLSCLVRLDLSVQGVITVTAIITTTNGPFTLVATISAIGVTNLQVS